MPQSIKRLIFISLLLCTIWNLANAQRVIQNKRFEYIPVFENKPVLLKEIPLNGFSSENQDYKKIKNWVKKYYTTDIINSSILYDRHNLKISVGSKVELPLSILNKESVYEKAVMLYYMNISIVKGKCVLEIHDFSYKLENTIPKITDWLDANELITKKALGITDSFSKERREIYDQTLSYFNNLAQSLAVNLSQKLD